jgi:hypothetical protein
MLTVLTGSSVEGRREQRGRIASDAGLPDPLTVHRQLAMPLTPYEGRGMPLRIVVVLVPGYVSGLTAAVEHEVQLVKQLLC